MAAGTMRVRGRTDEHGTPTAGGQFITYVYRLPGCAENTITVKAQNAQALVNASLSALFEILGLE